MDFAVKVMDQSFIRKENKAAFVLTERKVMSRLAHPNIVKFYCSFRVRSRPRLSGPLRVVCALTLGFLVSLVSLVRHTQDSQSLYLAMELCRGGDLFGLIRYVCELFSLTALSV